MVATSTTSLSRESRLSPIPETQETANTVRKCRPEVNSPWVSITESAVEQVSGTKKSRGRAKTIRLLMRKKVACNSDSSTKRWMEMTASSVTILAKMTRKIVVKSWERLVSSALLSQAQTDKVSTQTFRIL